MRVLVLQVTLLLLSPQILPAATEAINKNKRSALELGYVTFADVAYKEPLSSLPATVLASNKAPNGSKNKVVGSTTRQLHHNVRHEWIPGHVDHHSYIPAHVQHIMIPTHALILARTVHVLVPETHKLEIYNPYRAHYGGFGIGMDYGGHGAGHGFHAVYNF